MSSSESQPPQTTGARARPTSLSTIAKHLGLSVAAISRVLNHSPAAKSIPQATQERIFAAARELNYRPNVLARSLRHGKSFTVGVLVPEISEGYATLVLAGLEQALQQAGYFYLLISHHHQEELISRAQTLFIERAVDGLIAIDTLLPEELPVPVVTVSSPSAREGITNIVLDHGKAADLAIEHLASLGHRHLAVIKGQAFSSDTEFRWQAIQATVQRVGMQLDECHVVELEGDGPSHEPGYLATQRLLSRELPFTALFAFNDVSAIGAIRALREAGLSVPEDVSVVGFDDIQSAAFQNPGLTTVRQPLRAMGMLAAETLIRQIGSEAEPQDKQLLVNPELIVRDSTKIVSQVKG